MEALGLIHFGMHKLIEFRANSIGILFIKCAMKNHLNQRSSIQRNKTKLKSDNNMNENSH